MAEANKPIAATGPKTRLCHEVEIAANLTVSTPKDFDTLSQLISLRTGILLSPTTLKRLWGYLDEPVIPRRSTLDTLSRFCGWRDYEHFLSADTPEIESGNVGSNVIRAGEDIHPGGRVRLFWNPSRVCEIEYLGNLDWRVVASEGTRLNPGDRFRCPMILAGEPLYLDNLIKDGNLIGVYVCGSKTGITFKIPTNNEKD
ncbi:MAG: hypothetical protein K2N28_06310 [Muribaculaceae bacterium]|nr:hypothetical protein [Muribaculaceae bacterium]